MCRFDRSTYWPGVQCATTLPRIPNRQCSHQSETTQDLSAYKQKVSLTLCWHVRLWQMLWQDPQPLHGTTVTLNTWQQTQCIDSHLADPYIGDDDLCRVTHAGAEQLQQEAHTGILKCGGVCTCKSIKMEMPNQPSEERSQWTVKQKRVENLPRTPWSRINVLQTNHMLSP